MTSGHPLRAPRFCKGTIVNIPSIPLNDGNAIPSVGLGLWRVTDEEATQIVREGVECGYRSLDTATLYGNEAGVGAGIRECGLPREQLFIATKLWNDSHGYDATMRAFDESMKRLRLEYLDLYLIHWPVAGSELYLDSWRAFIKLREEGRVRSIGVSNFLARHLRRVIETSGVTPAVNQIESHPYFKQSDLLEADREAGILTEVWAPLGRATVFTDPVITEIAGNHGKTPAQVVLRWHVERGVVAIPKTVRKERMLENIAVFDFSLTAGERAAIDAIDTVHRISADPETYTGL